jgi:hypothetical protein
VEKIDSTQKQVKKAWNINGPSPNQDILQRGVRGAATSVAEGGVKEPPKSIPGTSAQNGSGEGDLTAKDDRKLHPTVQIAQIVRELLDG